MHRISMTLIAIAFASLPIDAMADCQGQFSPMIGSPWENSPFTHVHYFPKNGNQFRIEGRLETIPTGTGVISGGVTAAYNHASIDEVPGQTLAPNTTYFVYLYMQSGAMTMDFSRTGHKEDPSYGNEVHATDSTRSLIGMVHTNSESKINGSSTAQMTLSWCNRGHLGVIQQLDGDQTGSSVLVVPNSAHKIEWLQWGINNSFLQGANSPNIWAVATVGSTKPGGHIEIDLAVDGVICGVLGAIRIDTADDARQIVSFNLGSNGTNEGYHYAQVLLSNAGSGGTVKVSSGAIWATPLDY
jgi:hypothetical protein